MAQLLLKVKHAIKCSNTRDLIEAHKACKQAYKEHKIGWAEFTSLKIELSKGL